MREAARIGEAQLHEEIARLMNLQTIDRELHELGESLVSITQRVDRLRTETEQYQSELVRLMEEDKQAELARSQLERELAEGETRIRNKRMRQNLIRNEKELMALSHEVESLKENNQRLEAELLIQMEAAEPRAARVNELTKLVNTKTAELFAAEKEIAGQAEELKETISRRRAERESLAQAIDVNLRQRYEMLLSRRAGVAITCVKLGTCQGCRMRLPPQLYNEIQKFEQIHFCPNCQRILYYEP